MYHHMFMCPFYHYMMPMMGTDKMQGMPYMMHMPMMHEPMMHSPMMHMPMMHMMPMLIEMEDEDDYEDREEDRISVEEILNRIERNDPQIFAILRSFGMPMPVARRLVRRIIRLTLRYSR